MTERAHLTETRAAYDTVAADYAALVPTKLSELPLDRALLGAFAELARATGGVVADLGCGPGHVTAHLAALGVDAFGVDLSPRMVALARRAYPELRFAVLRPAGGDRGVARGGGPSGHREHLAGAGGGQASGGVPVRA
ncbi:class I SAM-dependent methyltransferase [Micromonospora terminaliae]|uniref:class I SAM-dependent methyltransferase n=1 Tax=Micromonospora terminaliae TaxID=1914461 RepID=UPI0030B8D3DE